MWGVILALAASALSQFVAMILSSIAAEAASSRNASRAHSYSRASALVSAFSVFLLILGIFLVYFHKPIASKIQDQVQGLQDLLTKVQKSQ